MVYEPGSISGFFNDFKKFLILKEETKLELVDDGGNWTKIGKNDTSFYAEFDIPVSCEDITAIAICNTIYELNNSNCLT